MCVITQAHKRWQQGRQLACVAFAKAVFQAVCAMLDVSVDANDGFPELEQVCEKYKPG